MQIPPSHLVFATNFSETCHAAIPAVAQLVDRLRARLTLLHVHAKGQRAQAQDSLESFFAEASHYPGCERTLCSGPAAAGIAAFCRSHRDALLIMPPSERTGLPRPLHASLRAQVLQRVTTPMLTLPHAEAMPPAGTPGGHVAYWLRDPASLASLRDAAALARRRGAELHLLHVVPPISEGLLMDSLVSDQPLTESAATDWLGGMAARLQTDGLTVRIHVSVGTPRKEITGLLRRTQADVLVVERDALVRRGLWRSSIDSALSRVPCLLVCLPSAPVLHAGFAGHRRLPGPRRALARQRPGMLSSLRSSLQRNRAS